jgi:hypothetical protein
MTAFTLQSSNVLAEHLLVSTSWPTRKRLSLNWRKSYRNGACRSNVSVWLSIKFTSTQFTTSWEKLETLWWKRTCPRLLHCSRSRTKFFTIGRWFKSVSLHSDSARLGSLMRFWQTFAKTQSIRSCSPKESAPLKISRTSWKRKRRSDKFHSISKSISTFWKLPTLSAQCSWKFPRLLKTNLPWAKHQSPRILSV